MSNWKRINNESQVITAMVVLCQDYVMFDEEFSDNVKIKKNMNNADFWIELAQSLRGSVEANLRNSAHGESVDGYDEYEDSGIADSVIMSFIMNPSNRFELNDTICETIEGWLKHFGGKRSK